MSQNKYDEPNSQTQNSNLSLLLELSPEAYERVEKRFQEFMRELKPMSDATESSQRLTGEDYMICINT